MYLWRPKREAEKLVNTAIFSLNLVLKIKQRYLNEQVHFVCRFYKLSMRLSKTFKSTKEWQRAPTKNIINQQALDLE